MKKITMLLILIFVAGSYEAHSQRMSPTYTIRDGYLSRSMEPVVVYQNKNQRSRVVVVIPHGATFVVEKYNNGYARIRYGNHKGYAYRMNTVWQEWPVRSRNYYIFNLEMGYFPGYGYGTPPPSRREPPRIGRNNGPQRPPAAPQRPNGNYAPARQSQDPPRTSGPRR